MFKEYFRNKRRLREEENMKKINTVIFDMDGTVLSAGQPSDCYTWPSLGRYAGDIEKEWQNLQVKYQDNVINMIPPETYPEFYAKSCALLTGKPAAPILEKFSPLPYTPGFGEFCSYLRRRGIKTGLVTFGVGFIAQKIREEQGLDELIANEIHVDKGIFTGTGRINIQSGEKGKATRKVYEQLGASRETTAFFGDSANDLGPWSEVAYPFGISAPEKYHHLLKANFSDFHQAKEYVELRNFYKVGTKS